MVKSLKSLISWKGARCDKEENFLSRLDKRLADVMYKPEKLESTQVKTWKCYFCIEKLKNYQMII